MLIGIDGNEANIKKRVGVNQFAFQVLWGIYKNVQNSQYSNTQNLKFRVFLAERPLDDMPPETDWWQYEVFGPRTFWTWTGLVKRLHFVKPKPDIIYSPSHYGPLFSPIKSVISIMDLGFLKWPGQFTKKDFWQLKYMTMWSVKRAEKIITISEFSKKDIVETYGIAHEKVVVAYPGYKKVKSEKLKVKSESEIFKKYSINSEYILYLGTLKPSKNIDGLIKAFKKLQDSNVQIFKKVKLVIAGKKGWMYEELFQLVKKLDLESKVIFTGFVEENEVDLLMKNAQVFVMPSYWEGFGIPILEAMDAGTPVVCSNRGALPEVAGKAALIVNPEKPADIAEKIYQVLTSDKLRENLVQSGKERVKMFSWQKSADKILNVLINNENNQ